MDFITPITLYVLVGFVTAVIAKYFYPNDEMPAAILIILWPCIVLLFVGFSVGALVELAVERAAEGLRKRLK